MIEYTLEHVFYDHCVGYTYMEQEKKNGLRFLRWPWNVVIYILLAVVLRLFSIPVILFLMWLQKKYNPHGVAEGYCLSRTRKRLPGLLLALLFLFIGVALSALFYSQLNEPRDDWEFSDYAVFVFCAIVAVAMFVGGIYEAFVSVRDTFFPAKSSLAKSIRRQLPFPEEAPPVGELFAMVDDDLREHGEWFDAVGIGDEWVLGDVASRIDRIRGIFTVDELHQHHTQTGVRSNRVLELVLVDDRWQMAVTTFHSPKELRAAADCLGFRVPSAFRGFNRDYADFLAKDEVEREAFEREFRQKEARRASNWTMREAAPRVR